MESYFSNSYFEARNRFIQSAQKTNAQLLSFPVNAEDGLFIDVALFRCLNDSFVIHVSGTHGPEGYAGSAIQLAILDNFSKNNIYAHSDNNHQNHTCSNLPTIALIHALNPYGFATGRRVNENNIDLNRNFLNKTGFHEVLQRDPNFAGYMTLDYALNIKSLPFSNLLLFNDIWGYIRSAMIVFQFGLHYIKRAIVAGNYHIPTGLGYGGKGLAKSSQILIDFVTNILEVPTYAKYVALIDVHTGLGPYGVDTIMGEFGTTTTTTTTSENNNNDNTNNNNNNNNNATTNSNNCMNNNNNNNNHNSVNMNLLLHTIFPTEYTNISWFTPCYDFITHTTTIGTYLSPYMDYIWYKLIEYLPGVKEQTRVTRITGGIHDLQLPATSSSSNSNSCSCSSGNNSSSHSSGSNNNKKNNNKKNNNNNINSIQNTKQASSGYELTRGTVSGDFARYFLAPHLYHTDRFISITQEFGTVNIMKLGKVQTEENYAYHYGNEEEKKIYNQRYLDCFYLAHDNHWKYNIQRRGVIVFNQALQYIMKVGIEANESCTIL